MSGRLAIGTSGYNYPDWVGPFYPPGTRPADMLRVYATHLSSVEINYTFRRDVSERTIDRWRDATPEDFRFALKAHQRITHVRRLGPDAHKPLGDFLARTAPLGQKLGVILFQCSPTLKYDRATIEAFLSWLPKEGRFAFEFRHPSWAEARELIASHGAAWCVSDTDGSPAAEPSTTGDPFLYLRLRREEYAPPDLKAWADRVRRTVDSGSEAFVYVKHEEGAAGALYAEQLAGLVRAGSEGAG
jgi:uncharacterized protein YecE (DUF72 family)